MARAQFRGIAHGLWVLDVIDGLPVYLDLHPAALSALLALREVPKLVVVLRAFKVLRKAAGHRGHLPAFRFQLLDGGRPESLVIGVAREQEGEHIPNAWVGGHLVEAGPLQAPWGFGGQVGPESARRFPLATM